MRQKYIKNMKLEKKIKKVKAKHGTGSQLARLFCVTTKTVSEALNGKSNTELAKKIRKAAIEMGGDPIYN